MKGHYFIPQPAPNPHRRGAEKEISTEAYAEAQRLIDNGYDQQSRKYRLVFNGFDERTSVELNREVFAAFRELHPDIQRWSAIKKVE